MLAGAERALADPGLLAVIMELNGSGARYGFDEDALHRDLLGRGFETFRYRPFERVLEPLHGARSGGGNTLLCAGCGAVGGAGAVGAALSVGDGAGDLSLAIGVGGQRGL